MISEYLTLTEYASKSYIYNVAKANDASEQLVKVDSNYPQYPQKHADKYKVIQKKILAYGSTELNLLFNDSYTIIQQNLEEGKGDADSYKNYFFSMPLIASYIKYDLTGEIVNPSIFYYSVMKEVKALEKVKGMENYHKEMIEENNKLVYKYKLSHDFLWEE